MDYYQLKVIPVAEDVQKGLHLECAADYNLNIMSLIFLEAHMLLVNTVPKKNEQNFS